MQFEDYNRVLQPAGFLALGAFFTAARGKLASTKQKNNLHIIFYTFSGFVALGAFAALLFFWSSLFQSGDDLQSNGQVAKRINWSGLASIGIGLLASILLFRFTRKHLTGKFQFTTRELDPKVNQFTTNSDKTEIKLLAGDLNFFGSAPADMDRNEQYVCLKNANFRSIKILCFKPNTSTEKIRYGKLLFEMPVEIRYYDPPEADLNVRGRMKTLNNVLHLLIYNKVRSGVYEALELDTADQSGALYHHIWNLIWNLSTPVNEEEQNAYKSLFIN